jgi:hypothetical protein
MNKSIYRIAVGLALLLPTIALAQGGPSFNVDASSSYGGGKVTLCYQGSVRTVNANQAARLIDLGATQGPCTPPGTLVITKTATGGNATFGFYSHNGNLADFTIKTVNGTGSISLSLAHGSYNIVEKTAKGWKQVSSTCSLVTVTSGQVTTCTIANAADPASISGTTYFDLNGNGRPNFFQKIFNRESGVTVYLDTNNNGSLDSGEPTAVTNGQGTYKFANLVSGSTYHVREVTPAGYNETYPDSKVYNESVTAGQNVTNDDFANYQPTRGHRWFDRFF